MPRGIPKKKEISSEDNGVGQLPSLDIPMTGPLADMIRTDQEIITVDGPAIGEYAARLAFNEELVDVVVHESTNPNDQVMFDVYCNGVPQWFKRGEVQTVKRKYVAILAQARQTAIATHVLAQGGYEGDAVNRIDKHTAVRYPFSVVRDANPKGSDWLRQVLASA